MKTWRTLLGNERGVALPLAMILLVVLTMLTLTFMSLGTVEPQISRNLSDGARARQLAESGIEWGFNQLAGKVFDDPTLLGTGTTTGGSCGTSITCKVLVTGQALPGLTSAAGTFTVTLRNDLNTLNTDQALIGAGNTLDTSATVDNNKIVILKSTGTFNGASRTVTAVVQRGNLNINAALSLPGVQTDTFTNAPPCAGCYSIDGRDWRLADTSIPSMTNPTKLGIATYVGTEGLTGLTYEVNAEAGFDTSAKQDYVQGTSAGAAPTYQESCPGTCPAQGTLTTGLATIAKDTSAGALSPAKIQTFLTNLAGNPQTQILNSTQACQYSSGSSTKPEGLQMVSTGTPSQVTVTNNCTGAAQINQTVNLGTAASPALLYIKGEFDPSSNFIGMAVSGGQPITGYGVLVMEEADLSFFQTGQFQWNGIVVVTGRNVGVGFRAGSNTEIRGALIANETNPAEAGGYFEFLNQGATANIRYSKEGVDLALLAMYNMRISAYRDNY